MKGKRGKGIMKGRRDNGDEGNVRYTVGERERERRRERER